MKRYWLSLALIVVAVSTAVHAEDSCNLKTLEGTYAISERGSSLALGTVPAPDYPLHFTGAVAPFSNVALIAFGLDGDGSGFHWTWVGTLNGGVEPLPLQARVTEMKEDCTGTILFWWNLPGMPDVVVEERIIVFDNGREFRSVAKDTRSIVPGLAFNGTGQRIREAVASSASCNPQTVHGKYLITGEHITPRETLLANTVVMRIDIAMDGTYTGAMWEKLGARAPQEAPVEGTISVNPDCSLSTAMKITKAGGVVVTLTIKGIFFDEGKRAYAMVVTPNQQGIRYSLGEMLRIGQ